MESILEVQHLHKTLGGFSLKGIDFSLKPGYIMGLIGRNGAGKTTLIHTLMNLCQKEAGTVTVCGCSMEDQEKEAKDQIGFVLDTFLFEEDLSVAANGNLFGSFYSHYDHRQFLEFCRRFELKPSQKTGRLSKGEKTRFQLAFALSHQAKLFLMDEPAAGLDPQIRRELLGYMQEIVEDGTRSVLFSTHLTRDLDEIGDYFLLVDRGQIVMQLDMETFRDQFHLLYGTREEIENATFPDAEVLCRLFEPFSCSMLVKGPLPDEFRCWEQKTPSLGELMYNLQKGGHIL